MGRKKSPTNIPPNEQRLLDGIQMVNNHPLFGRLRISQNIVGKAMLGRNAGAKISYRGVVYLNKDASHPPAEWAHMIAHNMLHLAFGHFDAEKMPGFFRELPGGRKEWAVSCDFRLWNMACDIYICKFLSDVKFGTPFFPADSLARFGSVSSERKIYDYLFKNNIGASENLYGTAAVGEADMLEPDKPLKYSENQKNGYVTNFALALADSVHKVIGQAEEGSAPRTVMQNAALWFINHYPLLGGIASGFRVVDTRENPVLLNDISIAAVDVVKGEIYVNWAAGLNLEEWKFVLAHEYLHAGLQHHARCQGRDPQLWNAACDFVINGWLQEMKIGQMPERGLLYDGKLKNQSAEEIYDLLVQNLAGSTKFETFRGYGKGDIIREGYTGSLTCPVSLDEFCKNALGSGLEYHISYGRGYLPAGLIEEIKALSVPPIPWDVALAEWFEIYFAPIAMRRSYARPSRRQSSTPDIPRPRLLPADIQQHSRTFGVVIDTSGSMSTELLGLALGAAASYCVARDVSFARVVFCDADAYDIGYVAPEDIAGRVQVKGRGGTVLQPAIDLLESAEDFPQTAPILIITDGFIESSLRIRNEHAFLVPQGRRLPFRARGKVFYFRKLS